MRNSIFAGLRTILLDLAAVSSYGQMTSGGVQTPPNYNSFLPPSAGGSYVDPVFGTTIQRVTNATGTHNQDRGGFLTWIENEYATMSSFNNDNSRLILLHESYFALYDGGGFYLHDLPLEINAASEPRWSRKDLSTIYYHVGNQLKRYNITTGGIEPVHIFSEYKSISGNGEMDISWDGDRFVLAGDKRYVFVYQISTNTKHRALDTATRGFDSMYITPDNHVTITWNQSGTTRFTGIELFDSEMRFVRQVAHSGGHMDMTRDTNGDEVLVWTNSNDPKPIANCDNGIVKVRLADARQTCLAQLDWSLAVHISAPDGNGFVYVDTEAPGNPDPQSTAWRPYTNEILQIKLDGSGVNRLAHHRSRPVNSYGWQPKLSVSRDGKKLLFSSNYGQSATAGLSSEYSDTYLLRMDSAGVAAAPVPADTTSSTPADQTTIVKVEESNPAVSYQGSWYTNSGAFNSGQTTVLSMDAQSRATFSFTGTGARWIGFRDAWSGIAEVFVDGILKETVDTYSANDAPQTVQYSIEGLTNGQHTLSVVVTGRRNANSGGAWVWVDAFEASVLTGTSQP